MTARLLLREKPAIYEALLQQVTEVWPWSLPPQWRWHRIGDVAQVIGGGTPQTNQPENFGGDIPWITPADLSGYSAKHISRGARNISAAGLANSGARLMPAGTVLFSSRAPIGYVAIASNAVATNQGFKSFVLGPELLSDFVYYWLQVAKPMAVKLASGTTFLEVSGKRIAQLPIPVAPLAVQKSVVAYLDEQLSRLDASVAALHRVQANLKRYRASVLKTACEGRLVPTEAELARQEGRDFETGAQLLERVFARHRLNGSNRKDVSAPETKGPLELPEAWALASVDMVGDVLLGRQRAPQYLTGDSTHCYLRVANIKDDRIDFDDLNAMDFDAAHFTKYRLEPGDILVSEGQSPELLGQSAIFRGYGKPLCFQKTLHRFRAYAELLTPEFAQLVFRSHLYSGVFRKFGSITTNIGHLTLNRFKAVWFPLPPLAEQHRIVAEADRRLTLIRVAEAQVTMSLARAKRLRQSILQAAFVGPR